MLHSILSKLPRPLDLESLIQVATDLFRCYPPERLPGRVWSRISTSSVLKTTRDFDALSKQRLEDGEKYFEQEAVELNRQAAREARNRRLQALARKYRRTATYSGLAVFVAVIAMLARGQNTVFLGSGFNTALAGLQRRALEIWQRFL